MKLELYLPFPKNTISQEFDKNATSIYREHGVLGHTAIDWDIPHGTPYPFCADESYCYSVINKDNPDPMRYRAVFTLVETQNGVYEVSYGHCDKIYAEVGKTYRAGEILGTVGNTGDVFAGGRYVTREEKLAGSTAGSHAHAPQVRPVKKVVSLTQGKQYLYDGFGLFKKDGYYYEIIDYDNGYNGCIDPEPFFNQYLAIKRDEVVENLKKQISTLQQVIDIFKRILGV